MPRTHSTLIRSSKSRVNYYRAESQAHTHATHTRTPARIDNDCIGSGQCVRAAACGDDNVPGLSCQYYCLCVCVFNGMGRWCGRSIVALRVECSGRMWNNNLLPESRRVARIGCAVTARAVTKCDRQLTECAFDGRTMRELLGGTMARRRTHLERSNKCERCAKHIVA